MIRAGIIGASGYSGMELTRLLAGHPQVSVGFVTSDRWGGQAVGAQLPLTGKVGALKYVSNGDGVSAAKDVDVVFLATPAETSHELAPKLLALGVRVVDLSGAFRLKDVAQYPKWYAYEHRHAELVAAASYGLPELFRAGLAQAKLVANPGCYATAAALSVAPLLKAKLVDPASVVISAASGVSGAGRKATEDFSFMEVDSDLRAYRVLKHQHTPEIDQTVSTYAAQAVRVVFTPHLLPMKRGILSTAVCRLSPGVTAEQVQAAFTQAYGAEPLIRLASSADAVRIASVVNTPLTQLGASCDDRTVVAAAALDNLLKGAASQAVQNVNLLFGRPETEGLV